MGSYEDHLLGGTVDVPSGNVKRLRAACDGLQGVGTAANPVTIRLAAGTYLLDRPLKVPNFCTLRGAGRDSTVIKRSVALVNIWYTASSGSACDPVLDAVQANRFTLEDCSVIHTGTTDTSISQTTKNPVALWSGDALALKINRVRLEASYSGWIHDSGFPFSRVGQVLPIPNGVIGNEDYQCHISDSLVIGHSFAGAGKQLQVELYATNCVFLCDIRSTDVLQTVMPAGYIHWEYVVGYYKSCHFILQSAQTLTVSNVTEGAAAFTIKDTAITDTIAYCDDCTFYLNIADGDINSANSGACCVYVGGNNPGGSTLYPANVFKADNCRFKYETGTITSSAYICGLYLENQSGVNLATDAYLNSCTFEDIAGSGGTLRRDVVITGRLGNVQARKLEVRNCNILDYAYRNVSGSPVYTHSAFMTEPNTMNNQFGSVTFASAATAAATLALNYTASAGITDYWVGLEPSANETFWVSSKTNSGFTVNSSNATSAATIKYLVRR